MLTHLHDGNINPSGSICPEVLYLKDCPAIFAIFGVGIVPFCTALGAGLGGYCFLI
jgi:hypothetical protein